MISEYMLKYYCSEDISLIENYEQAVTDKTQTWHCHHRLETDLGLSPDELKEQDKYFNVPASELIFLTPSEHSSLHQKELAKNPLERIKRSERMKGENNPMYRKNYQDYMTPEAIELHNERVRLANKGKSRNKGKEPWNKGKKGCQTPWNKGKHTGESKHKNRRYMNNGVIGSWVEQNDIDKYIQLGYKFGYLKQQK